MENWRPEEENIIKDIRNYFRPKKEQNYTAIKDVRKLFRLEQETKAINDRILRDVENLFEHNKGENCYKPERISNFWSNFWSKSYIEYESKSDRNKSLSVEEYLNKVRLYLKDIINNLKKSDSCKIQLTISNNFISSIDNDNIKKLITKKLMINDEADEIIK